MTRRPTGEEKKEMGDSIKPILYNHMIWPDGRTSSEGQCNTNKSYLTQVLFIVMGGKHESRLSFASERKAPLGPNEQVKITHSAQTPDEHWNAKYLII